MRDPHAYDRSLITLDPSNNPPSQDQTRSSADLQAEIAQLRQQLHQAGQAEARFRHLFDCAPIPYQSLDSEGCIIEVNQTWLTTLGYNRSEVMDRWFGEFLVPAQISLFRERFPLFKQRGHIHEALFQIRCKNGTTLDVSFTGVIGRNVDGSFRQTHCVFENVTQRTKTQAELEARNQTLRTIFANAPHPMVLLTANARVADINLSGEAMIRQGKEAILGQLCGSALDCIHANENEGCGTARACPECSVRTLAMQTLASGQPVCNAEGHMTVHLDGQPTTLGLLISTAALPTRDEPTVLVSLVDITRQKQSECERQILLEVLTLVNTRNHTHEMLAGVTQKLQEWSGCQTVGVRLRGGEDFPYFETRGFPPEFVLAENSLCALDAQGEMIRDSQGNPILECMCGNVLCGRTDATKPFFTTGGSFWTNSTTKLLASTTEADRQADTRNRCHGQGYESVALIPLRAMGQTYGLLQFNDTRAGMFDAQRIALFERIATDLAIGLAQRSTSQDLRDSEERYRRIVDTAQEGIWVLDADQITTYVNSHMAGMLGFEPDEIVGRPVTDFMLEEELQDHADKRKGQEHGAGNRCERRFHRKDGTVCWTLVSTTPLTAEDGQMTGSFGMLTDITARKQAEAETLQMQQQLFHAQKLESLGILAGGIAHDFNNLLTVVLGQGNYVLKRLPAASALRENLDEALFAARRAADLTRQMLAYSGKGIFTLEQVDLGALVKENVRLLRSIVPKTITMDLELASELPCIQADRSQIQQVVMNLITNGSEAIGDEPGLITLATSVQSFDEATLRRNWLEKTPPPGSFVCLTVTDTGCGMDPATLARLFDPFFTTKFTGRGLGMSVVMGVVKGHNGAILVESTLDVGTTVHILFPLARGVTAAAAKMPQAKAAPAPLGGTVLVVDDEPPLRELCKVMLESMGMKVLTAGDGQEALEIFRAKSADITCVLLDIAMPKMDGRKALASLHRMQPGVKVILTSGYGDTGAGTYPEGYGPVAFLQKPFAFEDLEAVLQKIVGTAPPSANHR